jgi:diguanylate cyclase (GGDEF)-like protein
VWLLIALLSGLAAACQARVAYTGSTPVLGTSVPWFALVGGFVVAELCVVHLTVRREALSFAFAEVPWVLGLFAFPLDRLIAARVLGGAVVLVWHRRQSLLKLAFNVAQIWLGAASAAAFWQLAVGGAGLHSLRAQVAAVGSAVVIEVVAALAISAVVALHTGGSGGLPLALGTGTAASAANACFALVALDVVLADWRSLWTVAVLAGFLWLAPRAHVTLLRRHDAMERLNAFTRRVGSSDLHLETVVAEVLHGARDLLEVETVVLDLTSPPARWLCDSAGVRADELPTVLPAPSLPARRRSASVESLTVLLHGKEGPVGALTVGGRLGAVGGLTSSDLQLLEAVAGHAAVGLHNGDLADRLRAQAQENEHQALHDALTGLPNRLLFDRTAAAVLAGSTHAAVLLLDLDRFKEVNDTLGHAAGDEVLRSVGDRLHELLEGEACVARLGGDEFAVVLGGADLDAAQGCATRIAEVLAVPLRVLGVALAVDASIGIALAEDGDEVADLLRRADVAMYQAKGLAGHIAVYAADRDHNSAERLSLVAALRTGIANDELFLEYQPKASTSTGAVSSVEALVRWRSADRGIVRPDEFIEVAEQTGLIGPLTDWVLATALCQCRRWLDEGLDLSVAVNVSPRTLHDPGFVDRVTTTLRAAGVPASRLILEVTEGALMTDPEGTVDVLWRLRRAGVRLSIDDLGVGQSSLSYLKTLPVHEVKVDRSFVTRMADDSDDQAIVEAVVHLAHRLGMTVVAEGVEDERTWRLLHSLGTDTAQGYWISRPLPAPEVRIWLERWSAPRTLVVARTSPEAADQLFA